MRTAIPLSIACFIAIACKPPEKITPPPAHATAAQVALADAAIFIGVGDIGMCGLQGDEQTAILVDSVLKADSAAKVPVGVFTLGDNAYPAGLDRDFVDMVLGLRLDLDAIMPASAGCRRSSIWRGLGYCVTRTL